MDPLVFQTDFGLVDGAVSAMYGVAYCVNPELKIHDLTHDITPYNIWEASYRLIQTINYWPENTVFVSVVDPGVGSDRKSVVVKTKSGRYIVTPDNGTLTHVIRLEGIEAVREIDEHINRLPRSGESYTFHGRDVYAYTGARLASGVIDFTGVGPELSVDSLVSLPIVEPYLDEHDVMLLENHGALAVGSDVITAFYRMESLELWAKITINAVILGGSIDISRPNIQKLIDLRSYYRITGRHPGYKVFNPDDPILHKKEEC